MTRIFLTLSLILSNFVFPPTSDTLRDPVILIESGSEAGAGTLIGIEGNTLYFLTAAHVIEDPEQIDISFYRGRKVTGKVFRVIETWDIGVISCEKPANYSVPASFTFANNAYEIREPVITIGHPEDHEWDVNYKDEVKDLEHNFSSDMFTATSDGILPGSSGGPILNEAKELIGMVQKRNDVRALCLSHTKISEILLVWDVPGFTPRSYIDPFAGEMVLVKGGSFVQKSTSKEVDIPDLYFGKFEVTQGIWEAVMGSNPSKYKNGKDYPVEEVSWNDAQEFIQKLNKKSKYTYRLPTEAEWEYAAGGGNTPNRTIYAGTNSAKDLYLYANYFISGDANKNRYKSTAPVGSYKSNQLGLYDMVGNVYEWCDDRKGNRRAVRGGSWRCTNPNNDLRIHLSGEGNSHWYAGYSKGFRLVRTL